MENKSIAQRVLKTIKDIEEMDPSVKGKYDLAKRRIRETEYVSPRFHEYVLKEAMKLKQTMK